MNRIAAKTCRRGCTLALVSALSLGAWAQTTRQTEVKRAKVVYAYGNDLVVRTEDNRVRHLVVPSDFKFTVDGKQVGVQDLKPGTELTQTITTTSEEKMVTNARNVDARVLDVVPPHLTVALPGNRIKRVRVPEGTTFTVGGQTKVLSELRKDMRLRGTVVTTTPQTVVSRARNVTGQAPAPVDTPAMVGVLLIIDEVDVIPEK